MTSAHGPPSVADSGDESRLHLADLLRAAGTAVLVLALVGISSVRAVRFWESGLLGDDGLSLIAQGRVMLDGVSPYPGSHYPPLSLIAITPFEYLPQPHLMLAALALGCIPATLWALAVSDWRCYAAALLWAPASAAVQTANPTIFIVFVTALAWRYRDNAARAGIASALAVSAKLISWPVVVWLWATRRTQALWWCLLVALVATAGLGAVIVLATGTSGSAYARAASSLSSDRTAVSYGIDDVLRGAGAPLGIAHAAFLALAVAVAILAGVLGRRGLDERSFAAVAIATMLAAPNLWPHSYAFLLLAVGVTRPRFSAVWLLPVLMYGLPAGDPGPDALARAWIVLGLVAVAVLAPAPVRISRLMTLRTQRAERAR